MGCIRTSKDCWEINARRALDITRAMKNYGSKREISVLSSHNGFAELSNVILPPFIFLFIHNIFSYFILNGGLNKIDRILI